MPHPLTGLNHAKLHSVEVNILIGGRKMNSPHSSPDFVQMLGLFIEGKEGSRGTVFVRQIESEFARLGLDEKDEFSDFQHELAIYGGREDDIRRLKEEAAFVLRRLAAREAPIQPPQTTTGSSAPDRV